MNLKKYRKSSLVTIALLLYITGMAIILLPRNTELGDIERWLTLGGGYVIVILLWFVLRKKEDLRKRRQEDMERAKQQHNKTQV